MCITATRTCPSDYRSCSEAASMFSEGVSHPAVLSISTRLVKMMMSPVRNTCQSCCLASAPPHIIPTNGPRAAQVQVSCMECINSTVVALETFAMPEQVHVHSCLAPLGQCQLACQATRSSVNTDLGFKKRLHSIPCIATLENEEPTWEGWASKF